MSKNRSELLEVVLLKGAFNLLYSKSLKECEQDLIDTIESYSIILTNRYLGPRSLVPKSKDWTTNILPTYDDCRFQSCLRVNRRQFGFLLNKIRFNFTLSKQKWPIEIQLAIALYRFGNDGSGVSFRRLSHIFGISEAGMIRNCTDNVIKALLQLEKHVIRWPSQEERQHITTQMNDILPGCVGYLDGTHIPLFEAPSDNHEAYYSRKQQYAIHLQGICDNQLTLRSITVGYPASAHDARVFSNSPLAQNPSLFLDNGEWIAADSAYKLSKYVITPFRENSTHGTPRERKLFNKHFSGQRVKIEQTFGILKRVFGSLRSLRIRVNKRSGHRRACEWITACIIVYNLIRPSLDDLTYENINTERYDIERNIDIERERDFVSMVY